jgi:hypothetical protein
MRLNDLRISRYFGVLSSHSDNPGHTPQTIGQDSSWFRSSITDPVMMQASCQCRLITFTCPLSQPFKIYACHCTECRRQSGSAFGLSAMFPAFAIAPKHPGDLAKWTRLTASGKTMHSYFCTRCGSRLLHTRDGVGSVSVRGGALEGLSDELVARAIHIWTSEAVVRIPDGVQTFAEEPPVDD